MMKLNDGAQGSGRTRNARLWSWHDGARLWIVEAVRESGGWWHGAVQVLVDGRTVRHSVTSIRGSEERARARLEQRVELVARAVS